ncbi:MAG: DUF2911 domain-containing protein [Deltaproteobacteria bacterium]|nr:DUF2911 domain-containing protein [Deltaproteobacteria bacterium]
MPSVVVLLITILVFAGVDAATLPGLDKSPADISAYPAKGQDKIVKVIYSRPQAKGRSVFGKLVAYDKVWRTGANEATEVTFFTDVTIGGQKIAKGTYSLFTIPTEKSWTVILNKELNQWGAFDYKKESDVIRTIVQTTKVNDTVDAFTITFDDKGKNQVEMILAWENTSINIPIQY